MDTNQTPMTSGTGQADGDSWSKSLVMRLGIAFSSLLNEFLASIQFVCNPTQATQSYEKAGLIVQGRQSDPSAYPNVTKDAVAISATTTIAQGNPTGRAWGAYLAAACEAGADGSMGALELGMSNKGSEQQEFDTATSKTALGIVAGEAPGDKNVTVALRVVGGFAKFFKGIIFESAAMADAKNGIVYGVRNPDGSYAFKVTTEGALSIKHFAPPFISAPELPPMEAGEEIMWGDQTTFTTWRVFFDGGTYFRQPWEPFQPRKVQKP